MKYTLFIIIVILGINVSGQEYVPFPMENASWKSINYLPYCSPEPCGFDEYVIDGDITINGYAYKKLIHYAKAYSFQQFATQSYFGPIRNIPEKKQLVVYSEGEDRVLYDFDLSVGDTTYCNSDSATVSLIDSVLIGTSYRKRFHLNSIKNDGMEYFPYQLIEGIGSTNGLFWGPSFSLGFESYYFALLCHQVNDSMLYPPNNDGGNCPHIFSAVDETIVSHKEFIFPTVVKHTIFLNSEGLEMKYELFNINGEKVLYGKSNQIIVDELERGVYFVRVLTHDDLLFSRKVIIN